MKLYTALSYSVSSDLRYYGHAIEDFLASYWAIISQRKGILCLRKKNQKFFLDSGAFSAHSKKITINIDQYISFIKENRLILRHYAALDVIGDWQKTRKNQEYMEKKGLSPIPTFHFGSPKKELVRLISKYDYIALGGLVPLSLKRKKLQAWLDYCFSIIKDKSKVHGFGINALWSWKRYPWYSVDSTSAFEGSRRGSISYKGKRQDPKTSLLGFSMLDKDGKLLYKKRVIFMIEQNIKTAKEITKLWEKRGIKYE